MQARVEDLLAYLDASPTPYHAVAETRRRLLDKGFTALDEREAWTLDPGAKHFVTRGDGTIGAFVVGERAPAESGFRLLGAHTDSPNLRLKPRADLTTEGYRQLGVETYGGVLLHTWMDRDLGVAGRVTLRSESGPLDVLVDVDRPVLRIPNLAIHLQREIHEEGLRLDAQKHMAPVLGLAEAPDLESLLLAALDDVDRLSPGDVLAHDLMLYDLQPARVVGAAGDLIASGRLDNLASCHATLSALLDGAGEACESTRAVLLYDHEEVGSRSAQGAGSSFLPSILDRVATSVRKPGDQATHRARARSTQISVDMAHALHPNFVDRHEPQHRPLLGGGPVIKVNAGQSYATDAPAAAMFRTACERAGVECQDFVVRSDMGCGSTIGPITSTRTGIRTVDVGNPMWAMHSCRETASALDVIPMIDALGEYLKKS